MRILTSQEMAAVDKKAIEDFGIPGAVLMENASRGVATVVYKHVGGNSVLVVCGGGNNGGDGLAAARNLYNMGYDVEVVMLVLPESPEGMSTETTFLALWFISSITVLKNPSTGLESPVPNIASITISNSFNFKPNSNNSDSFRTLTGIESLERIE